MLQGLITFFIIWKNITQQDGTSRAEIEVYCCMYFSRDTVLMSTNILKQLSALTVSGINDVVSEKWASPPSKKESPVLAA